MLHKFFLIGVGLFLIFSSTQPQARAQQIFPQQKEYKYILKLVENYINDIATLESRFIQVNSDGSVDQGILYISRPGKMRIEYDKPNPYLLIANGFYFIFIDNKLEQYKHFDLEETPSYLILKENFTFDDKIEVLNLRYDAGFIRLRLREQQHKQQGDIELIFAANNINAKKIALRKWIIRDHQGEETNVTLNNTKFGKVLDQELFKFNREFE